jgi:hypothetical protein
VAALYFDPKTLMPAFRTESGKIPKDFKKGELVKASAVGLHCTLVHRKVFEKLRETRKEKPFFVSEFKNRKEWTPSYVYFAKLAKKAGFELFVDTGCIVGAKRAMTLQPEKKAPSVSA